MMASSDAKALLIIAASDLDANQIRQFLRTVERLGSAGLTKKIEQLRATAADDEVGTSQAKLTTSTHNRDEFRYIVDKIHELLVSDAGLSKGQAARLLYAELSENHTNQFYLPSYQKTSFDLWLNRLLTQVPQSVVMHVASKIRNSIVHGERSASDWPMDNRRGT